MGALALIEVDIPSHLESEGTALEGAFPCPSPASLKECGFWLGRGVGEVSVGSRVIHFAGKHHSRDPSLDSCPSGGAHVSPS